MVDMTIVPPWAVVNGTPYHVPHGHTGSHNLLYNSSNHFIRRTVDSLSLSWTGVYFDLTGSSPQKLAWTGGNWGNGPTSMQVDFASVQHAFATDTGATYSV
jgi:hypothetical protein